MTDMADMTEVTEQITVTGVPRFGQLTYTSFDGGAVGGWQVKQVRGQMSEEESAFLSSHVSIRFAGDEQLSEYPSAEEIANLPRRLFYAPATAGFAYWHTCPSGMDGRGRPGNVFAHVVLDRRPGTPRSTLRPTDLWGSPNWLRPFGQKQVADAVLDDVPDPPWEAVLNRRAVTEFVCHAAATRFGLLATLLDAVAGVLRGGPRIVFAAVSGDSAARWIASACHLMSPGWSRRLSWSLEERATTLEAAWQRGVMVAVVPSGDLGRIRGDAAVVVIDEATDPGIGLLGGEPHRPAAGVPVPVTAWSALAQVVLEIPDRAERLLAAQDEIAEGIAAGTADPGWALAMAVLDDAESAADASDEALHVLTTAAPVRFEDPRLEERWRQIFIDRFFGTTVEEALCRLDAQPAAGPPAPRDLALSVYLERAAQNRPWLMQTGGAPVPDLAGWIPSSHALTSTRDAMRSVLDLLTHAETDAERSGHAAHALRLVDLVARFGAFDAGGPETHELTDQLVTRVVRGVVIEPALGARLVDDVVPLSDLTVVELVRPVIADLLSESRRPRGSRLTPYVVAWLHGSGGVVAPGPEVWSGERADPVVAELAAQLTMLTPDPSTYRVAALRAALDDSVRGAGEPLDRLAAGPAFPAGDLLAALRRYPLAVLAPVLRPALLTGGAASDMAALVDEVCAAPVHPTGMPAADRAVASVRQVSAIRRDASTWWQAAGMEPASHQVTALLTALETLPERDLEALHADVLPSIGAAYLADVMWYPDHDLSGTRLAAAIVARFRSSPVLGRLIADMLNAAVDNGVVTERVVVCTALSSTVPAGPLATARVVAASTWQLAANGWSGTILDLTVRQRLRSRRIPDVPTLWEQARLLLHEDVRRAVPDQRETERWTGEYERAALSWWQHVGYKGDLGGGSIVSRLLRN